MDPCDVEFIGENTMIGVIPNFSFDPIHLISGTIGPFRAGIPVHIPLWMAIHLRRQQKCRIVPPQWMDKETLEDIKEEERRSRFFTKMPCEHYMIVAKLLFSTAPEDVPNSEEIRTAIKDIYDVRAAKLRTSMDDFIKGEGTHAKLDYLTMLEIHSVRPLLPDSLDFIARLDKQTKPNVNLSAPGDASTTIISHKTNSTHPNSSNSMLSSSLLR